MIEDLEYIRMAEVLRVSPDLIHGRVNGRGGNWHI